MAQSFTVDGGKLPWMPAFRGKPGDTVGPRTVQYVATGHADYFRAPLPPQAVGKVEVDARRVWTVPWIRVDTGDGIEIDEPAGTEVELEVRVRFLARSDAENLREPLTIAVWGAGSFVS